MHPSREAARKLIRREALTGAAVSLAINFSTNAWKLRGKGPHLLSVDSIGAKDVTVFSSAVLLALSLAFIVASINFFTFRKKAVALNLAPSVHFERPYFFFGVRQALASALFMFGAIVAVGVLWQRILGSLEVSTLVAASIAGLVAGMASFHASSRTSSALLRDQ